MIFHCLVFIYIFITLCVVCFCVFCKYLLMLNGVLNIKARGVDIEDADQSEHWLSANFGMKSEC